MNHKQVNTTDPVERGIYRTPDGAFAAPGVNVDRQRLSIMHNRAMSIVALLRSADCNLASNHHVAFIDSLELLLEDAKAIESIAEELVSQYTKE